MKGGNMEQEQTVRNYVEERYDFKKEKDEVTEIIRIHQRAIKRLEERIFESRPEQKMEGRYVKNATV